MSPLWLIEVRLHLGPLQAAKLLALLEESTCEKVCEQRKENDAPVKMRSSLANALIPQILGKNHLSLIEGCPINS